MKTLKMDFLFASGETLVVEVDEPTQEMIDVLRTRSLNHVRVSVQEQVSRSEVLVSKAVT